MKRALLLSVALAACSRSPQSAVASCSDPAAPDADVVTAIDAAPAEDSAPVHDAAKLDCRLHAHTWPRAALAHLVQPRAERPIGAAATASGRVVVLARDFNLGVYDPSTDTFDWIALPLPPPADRKWDVNQMAWAGGDRVLVFGAHECQGGCRDTAWAVLVDVVKKTVEDVTCPLSNVLFGGFEGAATLPDGRVLIANISGVVTFDPTKHQWSLAPQPMWAGTDCALTLLDGRVLFLCSMYDGRTTTLFDPSTGGAVAGPPTHAAHYGGSAVRLADGRVLVTGGKHAPGEEGVTTITELYDPSANVWRVVRPMPEPMEGTTGVALGCGAAAFIGGLDDGRRLPANDGYPARTTVALAWIYSPDVDAWTSIPMQVGRRVPSVAPLADGTAFIAGGHGSEEAVTSTEWLR